MREFKSNNSNEVDGSDQVQSKSYWKLCISKMPIITINSNSLVSNILQENEKCNYN